MKKKRISIFIIGLLILSNWLGVSAVKAQEVTNTPLTKEEWKAMPLYQGSYVGVDIFGLGSKLMGSDYFSVLFLPEQMGNGIIKIKKLPLNRRRDGRRGWKVRAG